jgi:phosphoribosylaminoimidazole-succinocarboxamide synthase
LITEEQVPPIEVIVKAALVGTPARIYHRIFDHTDRFGRRFEMGRRHAPYVRFDYRNPLEGPTGERLRDECMPAMLADRFIDTPQATESALAAFAVVERALRRVDLAVLDACFLFDVTGRVLCYEVSPDNMRVKRADWERGGRFEEAFDKDLWRDGADEPVLRAQWSALRAELWRSDA